MKMLMMTLLAATAQAQIIGGTATLAGTAFGGTPAGTLAISNVSSGATDTTIYASFNTNTYASPSLACGTVLGTYTQTSADSGAQGPLPPLQHQQIVSGLTPSTTYFCQITATPIPSGSPVTSNFSIATIATSATTAITGLTLGSITNYNSVNPSNQSQGDTNYNCKSSDGSTYMISDDSLGFTISGLPTFVSGSGAQTVMKVLSESPLTIQTFYAFPNYGQGVSLGDNLSSKAFGIFCMAGALIVSYGRQGAVAGDPVNGSFPQHYGSLLTSYDHGVTWNNPQNLGNFNSTPPNPLTYSMWNAEGTLATMGSTEFVHYAADDGTLGYGVAMNQHDNGNAYVYMIFNEGMWNGGGPTQGGGNTLYIARCARAKILNLKGTDWQWYKGGGLDGNLDSSWSSSEASAGTILSNFGELGTPNVVYVPAKNRYLMLTFFYPSGARPPYPPGSITTCTWLGYEAPHPWGPWTLVFTQNNTANPAGPGAYNPIILSDTIYSGTTPTVTWTGSFVAPLTDYNMRYATLTIN